MRNINGVIIEFDNMDKFLQYTRKLAEHRKQLDRATKEWQLATGPGDYVQTYDPTWSINIFGKLLAADEYPSDGPTKFGRWYSRLCPDGELGSNHAFHFVSKLTRAEFDAALQRIREEYR